MYSDFCFAFPSKVSCVSGMSSVMSISFKVNNSNELGNNAQALSSLNAVRARARGGNNAILPNVTTTDQSALRTAIWHERRVEMGMEFDRFFDLVREGQAATVLASKGFVAGKNEVWPIPQNEIDISAGTLVQNPGY